MTFETAKKTFATLSARTCAKTGMTPAAFKAEARWWAFEMRKNESNNPTPSEWVDGARAAAKAAPRE